jgi:stalled ribosome rescue protein Dom34
MEDHSFFSATFRQTYIMTEKNKKQYGVWMDSRVATIAGRSEIDTGDFIILGHVINPGADKNADEKSSNNKEITLTLKFFKEIAHLMPNIDEIHITGTGQIQEQFMKFLADTPQYKNAVSSESTSNKIGNEQLIELVSKYFN